MNTVCNKLEGNFVEIKVEISGEEWKKAHAKELKVAGQRVNVPGFRKGKVPTAMLKRYLVMEAVYQNAMENLLNKNYRDILTDNKVEPIAQPELSIDEINEEVCKVTLKVEVKPEITLTKYTGFDVTKETVEVTDEDVENELKNMQQQFAEVAEKEEGATVEENDTATIDFEGFVDGEAFEGGKGENYPLTIGSGSFIPGFEEQLIGLKAGEDKDVVVTFPEDYNEASLAGKEATFKCHVSKIQSRILPAYEELPEEAAIENVTTLEDLKLNIKTRLENEKERAAEEAYTTALYDALVEANPFDLPEAMKDMELQGMLQDLAQQLQQNNLDMKTYLDITGQTPESVRNLYAPQAEKRARLSLILEAVAKAEGIEVTDEEVEARINDIFAEAGQELTDEMKGAFESIKPQLVDELLTTKALEVIKK